MFDRLRQLRDCPLEARVAHAVFAFATAAVIGYAVVLTIAGLTPDRERAMPHAVDRPKDEGLGPAPNLPPVSFQDPQDNPTSSAGRRSWHELHKHAALQHVPYRRGPFTVRLVGAAHGRAVLAIDAPTIAAAHRGWRRFLRRYGDSGRSYLPRFAGSGSGAAHG